MRQDLTDITVVMDRSGSMASCRSDAEGGLNEFIEKQKAEPSAAVFSLVQFDTEYEFVHRAVPLTDVGKCTLEPRGNTALLDAIGKAIVETGERLKAMPEDQRPGLVVFVIITDGQENSSTEYKKPQIKEMIERQQATYKWQFTYLGANQDAFAEARGMGISAAGSAGYTPRTSKQAYQAASSNVARMRHANFAGAPVSNTYTDEERKQMSQS